MAIRIADGLSLATAIDSAVQYLGSARNAKGYWADFDSTIGPSNEWVTGYVGTRLSGVAHPDAQGIAHEAWRWLRRRRWWNPGWGFAAPAPPDADSTQWALHLAEAFGAADTIRARRAYRFLASHIQADGGLATFARSGAIRIFTGLLLHPVSFAGWCSSHPDVTAAAATLKHFSMRGRCLEYLRGAQTVEGYWPAYWWRDRVYTTALAVEALACAGEAKDKAQIEAAIEWTCSRFDTQGTIPTRIHPDGSPFATALGLRVLVLAGVTGPCGDLKARGCDWLLAHQRADGSWEPSAAMRIPPPNMTDPESYTRWQMSSFVLGAHIVLDQGANFTTATVLHSLSLLQPGSSWQ
jgi:squalene cyclase